MRILGSRPRRPSGRVPGPTMNRVGSQSSTVMRPSSCETKTRAGRPWRSSCVATRGPCALSDQGSVDFRPEFGIVFIPLRSQPQRSTRLSLRAEPRTLTPHRAPGSGIGGTRRALARRSSTGRHTRCLESATGVGVHPRTIASIVGLPDCAAAIPPFRPIRPPPRRTACPQPRTPDMTCTVLT